MAKKITNKLAHLPHEVTIDRLEEHPHSLELFISFPSPAVRTCPRCGSNDCVIKDSGRTQTVRHVACSATGILLTFHSSRGLAAREPVGFETSEESGRIPSLREEASQMQGLFQFFLRTALLAPSLFPYHTGFIP